MAAAVAISGIGGTIGGTDGGDGGAAEAVVRVVSRTTSADARVAAATTFRGGGGGDGRGTAQAYHASMSQYVQMVLVRMYGQRSVCLCAAGHSDAPSRRAEVILCHVDSFQKDYPPVENVQKAFT